MTARLYNLLIEQGSRFQRELRLKANGAPKVLTGYSAEAQIRAAYSALTPLAVVAIACDAADVKREGNP